MQRTLIPATFPATPQATHPSPRIVQAESDVIEDATFAMKPRMLAWAFGLSAMLWLGIGGAGYGLYRWLAA